MKFTPVWKAVKIEGSRFTILDRPKLETYLRGLPDDLDVVITAHKEAKPTRSVQQNSYYWGVVIAMIAEHTGHDADEVHEALKTMFLRKHQLNFGSNLVSITPTTTTLDTALMEAYLSRIREWASLDLGLFVPLPNEVVEGQS